MTGTSAVAVVGAGIGGLTVAAALRRAGVACVVYEQARVLSEVGAGIQLAPNAVRLLYRLGLKEALTAVAVRPEALEIRRWDDDRLLARTVLGASCAALYGAPYHTIHRADLHRALAGLLPPDTVRLGHRLAGMTEQDDGVTLSFVDGTVARHDVVIGADGIHSVVRDMLSRDTPVYSGHSVFRGLVAGERVPALVRDPRVRLWMGPGQHFVCYPVSAGRLVSFAATTPAADRVAESWSTIGSTADLALAYRGWNAAVAAVIGAAVKVRQWALHDREPLGRWSSARLTVLGDAAHPMLPFQAQGANQAVEDAFSLAFCLAATPGDHATALRRYEELRAPRTAVIQRSSRGTAGTMHLADGQEQRQRDAAMFHEVDLRSMAWLYGHDAEREAAGHATGTPAVPEPR